MMEHFIGKKEKRTNKGADKQYVAVSLLHCTKNKGIDKQYVVDSLYNCTTYHTQPLYQI